MSDSCMVCAYLDRVADMAGDDDVLLRRVAEQRATHTHKDEREVS